MRGWLNGHFTPTAIADQGQHAGEGVGGSPASLTRMAISVLPMPASSRAASGIASWPDRAGRWRRAVLGR